MRDFILCGDVVEINNGKDNFLARVLDVSGKRITIYPEHMTGQEAREQRSELNYNIGHVTNIIIGFMPIYPINNIAITDYVK